MQAVGKQLFPLVFIGLLAGCDQGFDFDLRNDLVGGFDTTDAANGTVLSRPRPDANGVITYPNFQVAVARRGETLNALATRIGANPAELARFNGMAPDQALRAGELVSLPRKVSGTNSAALNPQNVDVTPLEPAAIPAAVDAPEPKRHQVAAGETAFSVARKYGVPVAALAEWNGLDSNFTLRSGQTLIIPVVVASGAAAAAPVTAPGQGSPTPTPPSAAAALPTTNPKPNPSASAAAPAVPTPDLGPTTTTSNARMTRPVSGSIIRDYAKGRNEGIDISAAAGTDVRAADAGTVAAVTKDTNGVPIIVIKHANNLLTVYTNVDNLRVEKGARVTRGQVIAKIRAGDPSFLHFEVRQGLNSVDPNDYIN